MSDIVIGENMILEHWNGLTWLPIGCATGCSFQFSNELIGKTDRNAGLFRKYRARMSDCTADVQGLISLVTDTTVSTFYFLQEAIRRTQQTLRFRFTDEGGNTQSIEGDFLVASNNLTGDVSAFGEFDISFQGTGGVRIADPVIDPGDDPVCEVQPTLNLTLLEGEVSVTDASLIGSTIEIIFVDREGVGQTLTPGTPGNREFAFDNTTGTVTFAAGNPGNPGGEGIEVGWLIGP